MQRFVTRYNRNIREISVSSALNANEMKFSDDSTYSLTITATVNAFIFDVLVDGILKREQISINGH